MGTIPATAAPFRIALGRTLIVLALAAIMGGLAALPARADNDDNRGHGRGHQQDRHQDRRADDRDRYQWNDRQWRGEHPTVNVAPGYYAYAPPPMVYAPPPVPPSLNFIFPLDLG
jgi:hypothetical protein